MYTDDTTFTKGSPDDNFTVVITDNWTDRYDNTVTHTETHQVVNIEDADHWEKELVNGEYETTSLSDHRTIEVIDNDTNQTIKTIDLEFRDNGSLETRTETGFTNPNDVSLGSYEITSHYNDEGIVDSRETRHFDLIYQYVDSSYHLSEGYVTNIDKSVYNGDNLIRTEKLRYTYGEDGPVSKRIIEFREDGTEKFSSYESYGSDGNVDRRVEIACAEDGRRHEIETFYDEKGDITYQKVLDLDSRLYPISIREAVPFESNYDPESADNVEHVDNKFDIDGHVHTESYDSVWHGDDIDGYETRSNVHTTESWTDENGYRHAIETTDKEGMGDTGTYKEIVTDPKTGETTTYEGYYWTDFGNPETLVIEKQTVEQRREDGTLESKTVTLYDKQSKVPPVEIKTTYGDDGVHVEKEERVDRFVKEDETVETITRETTYDEDGRFDQITVNDTETTSLDPNNVEIAENENINDYYNDTDTDDRNEIDTVTDDIADAYVDIDEDDGDDWGDWRD